VTTERPAVRVLRVIARMNVGGPAYHVSLLSGRLRPDRFETVLVHGRPGEAEGSFEELARRDGCKVEVIGSLGPELRPWADGRSLLALARLVRRLRPHIVHTHTAKAGFVGRLAALAVRPRPIVIHTYHGHVLEGYFGQVQTALYRFLERRLAAVTDCLIGVSQATVDDLVRLGVAPRDRFRVVPIGLELDRFARPDTHAVSDFRRRNGVTDGDVLVVYVGRLVPIKRVDLALRAVARARDRGAPLRLAVVGDGECRGPLERQAAELGLGDAVHFFGYVHDATAAAGAADIALLSSDNEGTPVSLIEAGAASRPAVATKVGGVPDVVVPGAGVLVAPQDEVAMADALARLAADPELRAEMGARAHEHVMVRFTIQRLLQDVERLYDELVGAKAPRIEQVN
jgi:glycosyltransferase involved in cell wall biosynthesis